VFFAAWVVLLAGGVASFLLWWNRKDQLAELASVGDDFQITPVFAHFIKTTGEWLGFLVGIVFFIASLIVYALVWKSASVMVMIMTNGFASELGEVFTLPVIGFVIILATRFFSEQVRALAAIAGNTKKLVENK
jgi:hypothetical protein